MKKHLLMLLFLGTGLFSLSQGQTSKYPGDTIGIWTVIDFEQPSPYIHINPSSQNIWQVGKPQKTFFNSAYSVPNAIVTDTLGNYPVNNQSSFDLYVGAFNMGEESWWMYAYDIFIDFRHKFDTDTLMDGGYITVSWDKGLTWMNIINDSVYPGVSPLWCYGGPFGGNTNLYCNDNHLFNGEHGFSGRSDGWIRTCIQWIVLPVKNKLEFPPDTMIIRFNFISDGNNNNKEGWMIDQLRIFSIDLGSGIRKDREGRQSVRVSPNPFGSSAVVNLDRTYRDVEYSMADMTGRICRTGQPGTCNSFTINRGNLSPGIYLLKMKTIDQFIDNQYILISD